jgi:deoxyribodipyrimidine photo-lyase
MRPSPATRQHALALMERFRPRMGRQYADDRNHDRGPGRHSAVSGLSPFVRRRLVTEAELVAAAIATHGLAASAKFVQEVCWRSYFKGWLELRPAVWASYTSGLRADLAALEVDPARRRAVDAAEAGATGIACFDAWAAELLDTGYLHNHARMWFASIWIFTLRLPWRIGADFFYRHLLDGDPASNTLGWRWVAGLHTRGKPYVAQAWNIAKFTGGRHQPQAGAFAAAPADLAAHEEPAGLPACAPLRVARAPAQGLPTALLLTEEDCLPEDFGLDTLDPCAVATLDASHLRSPRAVAAHVSGFERQALADAASRLGVEATRLTADDPACLAAWATRAGATQIATPYVPVGPLRDCLEMATPTLHAAGITLREWRRTWDDAFWPHATAGFFKVKAQMPAILERMGLT